MSVLDSDNLSEEEKQLLRDNLKIGRDVDPTPEIPDAPDIAPALKSSVPGTFKNRIVGLSALRADELPIAGQHFVLWGSKLLDDINPRPVKKAAALTENAYAEKMRREAWTLIDLGVKDPLHRGQGREDRAEQYARWRYRGFVCGEVASL